MREKFAVARQGQRELAAFIKDNFQLTWFDIAIAKSVSLSQVSKVAKMFNLSRKVRGTIHNQPEEDLQSINN